MCVLCIGIPHVIPNPKTWVVCFILTTSPHWMMKSCFFTTIRDPQRDFAGNATDLVISSEMKTMIDKGPHVSVHLKTLNIIWSYIWWFCNNCKMENKVSSCNFPVSVWFSSEQTYTSLTRSQLVCSLHGWMVVKWMLISPKYDIIWLCQNSYWTWP